MVRVCGQGREGYAMPLCALFRDSVLFRFLGIKKNNWACVCVSSRLHLHMVAAVGGQVVSQSTAPLANNSACFTDKGPKCRRDFKLVGLLQSCISKLRSCFEVKWFRDSKHWLMLCSALSWMTEGRMKLPIDMLLKLCHGWDWGEGGSA